MVERVGRVHCAPRTALGTDGGPILTASLLACWVPLWDVDQRLWMAFGLLYAAHTTLNLASPRGSRTAR